MLSKYGRRQAKARIPLTTPPINDAHLRRQLHRAQIREQQKGHDTHLSCHLHRAKKGETIPKHTTSLRKISGPINTMTWSGNTLLNQGKILKMHKKSFKIYLKQKIQ